MWNSWNLSLLFFFFFFHIIHFLPLTVLLLVGDVLWCYCYGNHPTVVMHDQRSQKKVEQVEFVELAIIILIYISNIYKKTCVLK